MKIIERDLDGLIRKADLRVTTPRRHLLSLLSKQPYPMTIQEICIKLSRYHIDQVTVYRIVEVFKNSGLLREVDLRQGRPRYEIADVEDDHHHVVCVKCDKIEDFEGCDYEKLAQKALQQVRGFAKIESHSFELFGLCNTCVKAA